MAGIITVSTATLDTYALNYVNTGDWRLNTGADVSAVVQGWLA